MKRRVMIGSAVIVAAALLGSALVIAQGPSNTISQDLPTGRTGVSGPVEQGDFGFFRAAYRMSEVNVGGPIEQGDTGFYHSPNLPAGMHGISGPVEQGDLAFYRAPYLPVGKQSVSGPSEQGDAGF